MITITPEHIELLADARISTKCDITSQSWLVEGVSIKLPNPRIFAEQYSSYIVNTEFYSIGSFSYSWSPLTEDVFVGRYCSIAAGVEIMPASHPTHTFTTSSFLYDKTINHRVLYFADNNIDGTTEKAGLQHPLNSAGINIGNDVYIGTQAKIRRGVNIGNGAAIGAYSVVTKDVPPYAVVAGNPAKVVKFRFTQPQIDELEKLQWWNYDIATILNKTEADNIDAFIKVLKDLIATGGIKEFRPKLYFLRDLFLSSAE